MSQLNNILVVIQDNDCASSLLGKAIRLASKRSPEPSRIHVVRVVYEGLVDIASKDVEKSAELKEFILTAVAEELEQLVASCGTAEIEIETAVLWNRRLWEGVIHAAEAVNADTIIKVSEDDGRGFIRTPDDWNLLREANVPVYLARPNDWQPSPVILAAVDVLDEFHTDLSERILKHAAALSQALSGTLHICSFYPLFEPWSARLGLLQSYPELRKDIERDIAVAVSRIVRTIGAPNYTLHCVEGTPERGIERLADNLGVDIVVIGNRARDGIEAAFLGNTAEKILHQSQTDILTIA